MLFKLTFCVVIVLIFLKNTRSEQEIVVRILGGPLVAQLLAQETGHLYKGPVVGFDDTYIFLPWNNAFLNHQKRNGLTKRLINDQRVIWAEPQHPIQRQKRDYQLTDSSDIPLNRTKRLKRNVFNSKGMFNDELWFQEWYLQDTRTGQDLPKLDLNVLPLYRAGITGKGVRISVLDDGIEHTHEDLIDNYDPEISWDCNENDNEPSPRYESTNSNSHGTRCAGEIAMTANNKKCGVGIAYNARIGGVKLLDGLVTDRVEGTALSYAQDLVDIYSASWGPNDDGKTVEGPGKLAAEAIERGIRLGRRGKGALYVWASGNGGSRNDNCNCDGYLTSPYTISIGSASQRGEFPWYGEACASTLAVTYSSGAYKDQMIATTDLKNECTIKHTGTSASAPLAAGIIALALEVNPNLTWRDVQHLIVWTSELAPLAENPGWQKNAAGLWFNTRFGFGLMNAFSLVSAASNWTTVPKRQTCSVNPPQIPQILTNGQPVTVYIKTSGCANTANEVKYLEHVEVTISINYTIRGALEIYLISPEGTRVQILGTRKLDTSSKGFKAWTFMSVMTWGEVVKGIWAVEVSDNVGPEGNFGVVGDIILTFHGTKIIPLHMKMGKRNYNENYNEAHKKRNKYKKEYLNIEYDF